MDSAAIQFLPKPQHLEELIFDENIHGFNEADYETACKVIKSLLGVGNNYLINHNKTKPLMEGISSFNRGFAKR